MCGDWDRMGVVIELIMMNADCECVDMEHGILERVG
jgi:hypothetical protein